MADFLEDGEQSEILTAASSESGDLYPVLATWRERVLAGLLDSLIVGIPFVIVYVIALRIEYGPARRESSEQSFHAPPISTFATFAVAILLALIYFGILNGTGSGQTVGKIVMRIATSDPRTGANIGFGRAYLRTFAMIFLLNVFVIPGIIDLIAPIWTTNSQTLHDLLTRSIVIKVDEWKNPIF